MSPLDTLGINFSAILLSFIAFVLLVAILSKFAFGPMFGMLQQRQDYIKSNLNDAEARRAEMVRLQQDYEQRLATIEDEARDKIQTAVREAQAARDEIVSRAKTDAEDILKRGQAELEQERAKSLAMSRDQIAELAVNAAARIMRRDLDGATHSKLITDAIGELGALSPNGSGTASGGTR